MKNLGGLLVTSLIVGCSFDKNEPLEFALNQAGENKYQLEAVLNHFKNDSLKYRAASFLIENMPYHFSIIEYFTSPKGEKYRPDLDEFGGEWEVMVHSDSLLQNGYTISNNHEFDIGVIDSIFLITNIELAFEVWQKPWAQHVSFDEFCKYILPYRSQQEPLSSLRSEFKERFIPILDSAKVSTPLEACMVLNARLSEVMRYEGTGLPFYPTIEETYYSGISKCEGLCNLGTMIMRAVGIPVAVDMTVWVRMDLAHNWCAVLDNGKFYPFGPGEDSPDLLANKFKNSHRNKLGDVYRFNFEPDLSGSDLPNDDGYKTFLKSILMDNVTAQYSDSTIRIQVTTDKDIESKSGQVYLCSYNDYQWKPITIGNRVENICSFENIVGDNVYAVCYSPDGSSLRRITVPFYVSREGEINKLIPQKETHSVTLKKNPERLDLPNILCYWEPEKEDFVELKYTESTDTTQYYDNIPVNALLWFSVPIRMHNQRIFIIEDDSLKYY